MEDPKAEEYKASANDRHSQIAVYENGEDECGAVESRLARGGMLLDANNALLVDSIMRCQQHLANAGFIFTRFAREVILTHVSSAHSKSVTLNSLPRVWYAAQTASRGEVTSSAEDARGMLCDCISAPYMPPCLHHRLREEYVNNSSPTRGPCLLTPMVEAITEGTPTT